MRHEAYSRTFMEKYSRGRRGAPAKGVGRVTGAEVQIFSSPPKTGTHFVCLFFLFGGEGIELHQRRLPPARKGRFRAPSGKGEARNKEWQSSKKASKILLRRLIG